MLCPENSASSPQGKTDNHPPMQTAYTCRPHNPCIRSRYSILSLQVPPLTLVLSCCNHCLKEGGRKSRQLSRPCTHPLRPAFVAFNKILPHCCSGKVSFQATSSLEFLYSCYIDLNLKQDPGTKMVPHAIIEPNKLVNNPTS